MAALSSSDPLTGQTLTGPNAVIAMRQPIVELLVWIGVPGDTIFSVGALLLTFGFIYSVARAHHPLGLLR